MCAAMSARFLVPSPDAHQTDSGTSAWMLDRARCVWRARVHLLHPTPQFDARRVIVLGDRLFVDEWRRWVVRPRGVKG
jgi:hypothetical protein